MFEIGTVELSRRQHHHVRIDDASGRHGTQVVQQQVRIVLDRRDRLAGEQLREQAHHHPAVFQHVGHARRGAQVVLEHVVFAFAGAHQIDAGNVAIDLLRHIDADHLLAKLGIQQNLRGGNAPGLDDFLIVVNIMQEGIQGSDPLPQPVGQDFPLLRGNDARHDVEGDQAFLSGILAIHGEGDADAMKRQVGLRALALDKLRRRRFEPVGENPIAWTYRAGGIEHFVVGRLHVGAGSGKRSNQNQQKPCQNFLSVNQWDGGNAGSVLHLIRAARRNLVRACVGLGREDGFCPILCAAPPWRRGAGVVRRGGENRPRSRHAAFQTMRSSGRVILRIGS
jgi:hypothetical protein